MALQYLRYVWDEIIIIEPCETDVIHSFLIH